MHKSFKTIFSLLAIILLSVFFLNEFDIYNHKSNIHFDFLTSSNASLQNKNCQPDEIHSPSGHSNNGKRNTVPINESKESDSDEDNVEWDEFNKNEHDQIVYITEPGLSLKNHLDENILSAALNKIPTPPPESIAIC